MVSEKVRVLHLRDSPWVDGPGRTIMETADLIDKNKVHYVIGAFAGSGGKSSALIEAAEKRQLTVFPIREAKSFDPHTIKQITDYIEKHNINILHTHEVRSDLLGLYCAKKKKILLVTTLHGWITNNMKAKVLKQIDILSLYFFDMIIVVSSKIKHQLLRYGLPERKIHVLRNAIITDHYVPDRSDQQFRLEYNIPPETTLVGNIGRLSPEKGQADFIRAAAEILKKRINILFIFVGIGPDQEQLEQLAEKLGISHALLFTGFRKDMQSVYNSMDLVVQSSYTEGMPNVILEAALMMVPVIATDVGGTPEIIQDRQTGHLVPPGNVEALRARMEEFLAAPEISREMAINNRKQVVKNFDFSWRVKKLTELYQDLFFRHRTKKS